MRILKGTILLVFVCVFIRIAVGKPCVVPSGSMEPTLLCGDRLWINKLAYGGRLPKRWLIFRCSMYSHGFDRSV
mgnify:CR=1 FL=1